MISSYTLQGYKDYRFVGKKLYRLGYQSKNGKWIALHEIKLVFNNGSRGYFLSNESGKKYFSLKKIKDLKMLVKEKMVISEKERSVPF
jgi:hypothetical protein